VEISAVYTTSTPTQWQPPPEWMNFHYLIRAEQCPRSAALRYATYSQLWNRRGYPDKPSLAALSGTVMHRTVARIIRALADNGVDSTQDPRYVSVLKNLGGYSRVIAESVADVSRSLAGNPRFDLVRSSSLARLENRLPAIREHVQLQLAKLSWNLQPSPPEQPDDFDLAPAAAHTRLPLGQGTHFEVELRHPGIKWKGFVDLIELRDDFCAIEDFKSGAPSDDHLLQLQIYGLLWSHDEELNPARIAVNKLAICYPNGDRIVPYTEKDSTKLARALQTRTDAVRKAVSGPESQANLDAERCPKCDVRHLCSAYWTGDRPATMNVQSADKSQLDDIHLTLRSRKGQNAWLAECQLSNRVPVGSTVLLRWTSRDCAVLDQLSSDAEVRLSGASVSYSEDAGLQVVSCLTSTDLILPPSAPFRFS
jgi:CRISPR/Cas system-associated exonuclease Cas4 (RecB family)